MKRYYLADQSKIEIDDSKPIGKGGEGSVFRLDKNPDILVKIYTDRALSRMPDIELKIRAMTEKKPGLLSYNGLTIIAWPSHVVYNSKGRFVGYVMRRVTAKNQLSHVITPGLQKTKFPGITFYDRVVIAINLAKVMDFIHQNDTVIGDINTSDFFVYEGFEIGVVDTDSFQFQAKNKIFPCKVFTPDYTPPEVIKGQKNNQIMLRLPDHDNYGLAILIFQILMYGVHPFSARIRHTMGFDGNAINYCMEHEIFPYVSENPNIVPPKNAMPFSFLPKDIQDLFVMAFKPKKAQEDRPKASDWVIHLREMKESLKKCRKNKSHQYPGHFSKCPICSREHSKDFDQLDPYFPSISRTYVTYPTDHKPVTVDVNTVVQETLFAKVHDIRKKRTQAVFFNNQMIQKYGLAKRIDALYASRRERSGIKAYVPMPLHLIKGNDETIGYVTKKMPKRYRLTTFLRYNRLGRMKITEKTRLEVARNVALLVNTLSKANVLIEINQIFIDKKLNVSVPDIVAFGLEKEGIPALTFQKEDYIPYEHYLNLSYEAYLEAETKRIEEVEREEALREAREKSAAQAEAVLIKAVPKTKSLSEILEEETFIFETSKRRKQKDQKAKEAQDEDESPPAIGPFDPLAKASIRFRLAIMIHIILHDAHPFKGHENGVDLPPKHFIKKNMFLNRKTQKTIQADKKMRVLELYPVSYRKMMRRALIVKNPLKIRRPSSKAWERRLSNMIGDLKVCSKNSDHHYDKRLISCPYCHMATDPDPDLMRTFITTNTKRITDHLVLANVLINQLVVLSALSLVLYLLFKNGLSSYINLEGFKDFLGLDGITAFMDDVSNKVIDWLLSLIGR